MTSEDAEDLLGSVREIVADTRSGSSQISLRLLETLASDPRLKSQVSQPLLEKIYSIVRERRALASPATLVSIILKTLQLTEKRGTVLTPGQAAARLSGIYREALARAAVHLAETLSGYGTVLTLSKSSQVIRALKIAGAVRARILAGWPLMDGLEAYKELAEAGLSPEAFPDLSVGEALRGVDALIIGCDAVLPDGSAANRGGSYVLALAAYERGVPTIVICDSSKLDLEGSWEVEAWRVEWGGIGLRFEVFERVEPRLITDYICEWGRSDPHRFVERARRVVSEEWPGEILGDGREKV
jgi:translation initiation factor 2B subunit (eIF-2B alpha/beta/delta family)